MEKIAKNILIGSVMLTLVLGATPALAQPSQAEINTAIDDGLAYLATQQQTDGSWPGYGGMYPVGVTTMAVLAFENNGYLPGIPSAYNTNVENGLEYLFSQARIVDINPQPAGNPDTNGNGKGITIHSPSGEGMMGGRNEMYEMSMTLMAIVGSNAPGRTAATGSVAGMTYAEIARDMVDYIAWAQNEGDLNLGQDPNSRGGWRYQPNFTDSDNSVTPWPVLALWSAETLWGIAAPGWVKTELALWVNYSQNNIPGPDYGGFGYNDPTNWVNVAKTGGGLILFAYLGIPSTDSRAINAVNYLNLHWYEDNFGNFYAMYGVAKGSRIIDPPIGAIGTHQWYLGPGEYADWLVDNQLTDGSWPTGPYTESAPSMSSAWAILILVKGLIGPAVCGNGICELGEETSCPEDCPVAVCDNGVCEEGENSTNCLQDCPVAVCGNKICDAGENTDNCPQDCVAPPVCNFNGICEPTLGENTTNCPNDCVPPPVCNFNGICEPGENPENCSQDCPRPSIEEMLRDIKAEIIRIEEKLDGFVKNMLESIEKIVKGIEAMVSEVLVKLGIIEEEVVKIEAKLDNPEFGLKEIKDEVSQNERILIEKALLDSGVSGDIVILWLTKIEKVKAIVWDTIADLEAAGYDANRLKQVKNEAAKGDQFLAAGKYNSAWSSYAKAYKLCVTVPPK